MRIQHRLALALALLSLFWLASCSQSEASTRVIDDVRTALGDSQTKDNLRENAPLADYRVELLELAYSAASKFPLEPHIKNRSRAQDEVVQACFELGQPKRALLFIQGIENWRKGAGYADYAYYLAKGGDSSEVQEYLGLAENVALVTDDWRGQRIRAKIARTHLLLGHTERAQKIELELDPTETAPLLAERDQSSAIEDLDSKLAWVDEVCLAGNLDQVRAALDSCVKLYERFYSNEDSRARLEAKVLGTLRKAPMSVGLETQLGMGNAALANSDKDRAAEWATDVLATINAQEWLPEDEIPLVARVAELLHRAGKTKEAGSELNRMRDVFKENRHRIADVFRADALVPLAEAYVVIGDVEQALQVYALALDEGLLNPNSRPRTDDLVSICCSMAAKGIEPTKELQERLSKAASELSAPW